MSYHKGQVLPTVAETIKQIHDDFNASDLEEFQLYNISDDNGPDGSDYGFAFTLFGDEDHDYQVVAEGGHVILFDPENNKELLSPIKYFGEIKKFIKSELRKTNESIMEKKIARLKLKPLFEAVAQPEGDVSMVSTGATLSIGKDNGSSAIILDISAGTARYNKIENEELELPVLQNELAGLVGDFDNNVHKLFSKYGYKWTGGEGESKPEPEPEMTATTEAVNESAAQDSLEKLRNSLDDTTILNHLMERMGESGDLNEALSSMVQSLEAGEFDAEID